MNALRIVRSHGAWFIQRGKDQAVSGFFKTLEEARRALEEIGQKPEVSAPAKKPVGRSRKSV